MGVSWGGSLLKFRDSGSQAEIQEAEGAGNTWALSGWAALGRGVTSLCPRASLGRVAAPVSWGSCGERACTVRKGARGGSLCQPPSLRPLAWGVPAVLAALLGWLAQVSRGPRATVSTPWDHSLWDSGRMERWTDRQKEKASELMAAWEPASLSSPSPEPPFVQWACEDGTCQGLEGLVCPLPWREQGPAGWTQTTRRATTSLGGSRVPPEPPTQRAS